jgi:hypothetical protein
LRAHSVWQKLEEEVDNESSESEEYRNAPLGDSQAVSVHLENSSSNDDNYNLAKEDEDPDEQEHGVLGDSLEKIELIVDFTCVEHVEDLEPHEDVKN